MPKARAISRFPTFSGAVLMKSRISSLLGQPAPFGRAAFRASGSARHVSVPGNGVMAAAQVSTSASALRLGLACPGLGSLGLHGRLCVGCLGALGGFLGRRRLLLRRLLAALGRALSDQLDRLLDRERGRVLAVGDGGVDLVVLHVRPVTAREHLDLAALGVLAEVLQDRRLGALEAAFAPAGSLFGEQRDGAVEADGEHVLDALEVGVEPVVQHERSVAPEARP